MRLIKTLPIKGQILTTGAATIVILLVIIGLTATSNATIVHQTQKGAVAHRLAMAVANAYEQWTLDDDQSNMYVAVIALRDSTLHKLAEDTYAQVAAARDAVAPQLALASSLATSPAERVLIQRIEADLVSYNGFTDAMRRFGVAGQIKQAIHVMTVENSAPSTDLPLAFAALETLENRTVSQVNKAIDSSTADGTRLLYILGALSLLICALISLFAAGIIARPLRQLCVAANFLSEGNTEVDALLPPSCNNESGRLGEAFRMLVARQRGMAEVAEAIAAGDLTQTVVPAGPADTLGQAFVTMITHVREAIGQVAQSAAQVADGSALLSAASEQMGQASTQIARAIEDVATGTGAQSQSANDALNQMITLSSTMSQVATGTANQQNAVIQAEQAMAEMAVALTNTSAGVAAVTQAADRAAQTATSGGAAVGQTIASIDNVRTAVLKSAEQVAILGQRSTEVGEIVKAIDEIAEQTNLLALNAAIEAARAGEHGKGFAVVAAEVRKLAERAGSETKEISNRIAAIQTQVSDVVTAMQAGSTQVEQSAALGQQARSALQEILTVVEETRTQSVAISNAVEQMSTSVAAVRAASTHVARIATETGVATDQMRIGAEAVNTAITEIAAVSEQSAASAQEVSASTEEQSANVEEMAANAQSLAQQAAQLQAVVSRFLLDESQSVTHHTMVGDAPISQHGALRRVA